MDERGGGQIGSGLVWVWVSMELLSHLLALMRENDTFGTAVR